MNLANINGGKGFLFIEKSFILCATIMHWFFHPIFILLNKLLGRTRLNWLALDLAVLPFAILGLPTFLMGKLGLQIRRKMNAYSHIHFVCRSCPKERRISRDPSGNGNCSWNANWRAGNYEIPGNFGFRNWLRQYAFKPTQLDDYKGIVLPVIQQNTTTIVRNNKSKRIAINSSIAVWVILIILVIAGSRVEYLYKRAEIGDSGIWTDLGDVPGAADGYPPQGMTYWQEMLLFSNHWNDEKSQIYLLDPVDMTVISEFEMPPEAVHTSGLTFDGEWLWAIDYGSNYLYKISINESFESGVAVIEGKYYTGLKGSSAVTFIDYGENGLLAISDFYHTGKTYFVRLIDIGLLDEGLDVPTIASHSYHHGWFSQGLTWDGEYLYETVNNLGIDRIEVLDIEEWIYGNSSSPCRIASISFAGYAGEDLANDGISMWSSDESSYRFYKLEDYKSFLPTSTNCN